MISIDVLLLVCLGYVALLFGVAFLVDRRAQAGQLRWLSSPVIYTLSISVYCTSWTFYGAVGSAARNGLEFMTIYLGPTLVFIGWWHLLRKLVRIGRANRITSIADLISSRYGKSPSLAVLATLIALIATTPYIALQLQSVTVSYQIIAGEADRALTAFWIAAGMAAFAILFGTRNVDANERHHGVVAAIAFEAIVKLAALIAVGVFAIWGVSGGLSNIFADVPVEVVYGGGSIFDARWVALTFLSATAIICLPRQFQVTVVENIDERHLATASWMFPLYLFGMTLFIAPIAIAGLKLMPADANPDFYVLTLPLAEGREELALLAYLGGFSSATSMVIVAAIAVSTMVSNHIVMPVALAFMSAGREVSGDVRQLLKTSRRASIALILGLGYLYFYLSGGSDALAAIGLIAFAGVAQFLPSLLGALYWHGATRAGALAGMSAGFVLWAYTLLLPSFGDSLLMSAGTLSQGPWGIDLLRPQALMGLEGMDPLIHALVVSLGANALLLLGVSAITQPGPLERLQVAQFVDVFRAPGGGGDATAFSVREGTVEELYVLAQRILGGETARQLFDDMARAQGRTSGLPAPTDAVIAELERVLAGSVGAASAHAMVARVAERQIVGMDALIDIADEAQRLIETSRALSEKSEELEETARQLTDANERLRQLDAQKDEFLSQVSHELRTPMTSIRSFSEILLDPGGVAPEDRDRFAGIINEESQRLTRLLDEILDMSRLEAGGFDLTLSPVDVGRAIASAAEAVSPLARNDGVRLQVANIASPVMALANEDRLRQALINLIGNAIKYNGASEPEVDVKAHLVDGGVRIDVSDNGGGVSRAEADSVFEKFTRGDKSGRDRGAGLGLPISRAIMRAMGGDLIIEFRDDGSSYFQLRLPETAPVET